ncbi:MAG: hypothetical protein ACFE0Q_19950 [Anaerolineae bacterium]
METVPSNDTYNTLEERRFYLLVAMVFFLMIGVLMLVFAMTFIHDLQTLRSVPDALWNFLCGTPTNNEFALPLLLTIGIVSFGIGGVLSIWRARLGRKAKP